MKSFFIIALTVLLNFNLNSSIINDLESEPSLDKSQISIASKNAERYCNSKMDNFFKGLDNEKTLKYSYFKYIGFKNENLLSKEFEEVLINKIKAKCNINKLEEDEIKEFFTEIKE